MATLRRNPFTPTFGHAPFAFAGRDELIDDVIEGLANQPGDPNRATIFLGPRGAGKTVLMNAIAREASSMGWINANAVARRGLLEDLMYAVKTSAAHILDEQSLPQLTSVKVGPVGASWESPQESIPWRFRFQQIIEELNRQDVGVLFTIDEVNPECEELIEFISFFQLFVSEGLDVAMLLAGLPSMVSTLLQSDYVSFVRRAFQRHLGTIPDEDIKDAFLSTITENGKMIGEDALDLAVKAAEGFPFAMQLIGYGAWRYAKDEKELTRTHVEKAIRRSYQEMEHSVVQPTLRECSQREVEYLAAMAADEGPSTTSEVAARMGISMTNASNLRRRLIDRGVIKDLRMGLVDFDMPAFKTYLREHPLGY